MAQVTPTDGQFQPLLQRKNFVFSENYNCNLSSSCVC